MPILPSSISFDLSAEDADWASNGKRYTFEPVATDLGRAEVSKEVDGSIFAVLAVTGGKGQKVTWETPLPPSRRDGYTVVFRWDANAATFSINGKVLDSRPFAKA